VYFIATFIGSLMLESPTIEEREMQANNENEETLLE
jgi:hypothetical protein